MNPVPACSCRCNQSLLYHDLHCRDTATHRGKHCNDHNSDNFKHTKENNIHIQNSSNTTTQPSSIRNTVNNQHFQHDSTVLALQVDLLKTSQTNIPSSEMLDSEQNSHHFNPFIPTTKILVPNSKLAFLSLGTQRDKDIGVFSLPSNQVTSTQTSIFSLYYPSSTFMAQTTKFSHYQFTTPIICSNIFQNHEVSVINISPIYPDMSLIKINSELSQLNKIFSSISFQNPLQVLSHINSSILMCNCQELSSNKGLNVLARPEASLKPEELFLKISINATSRYRRMKRTEYTTPSHSQLAVVVGFLGFASLFVFVLLCDITRIFMDLPIRQYKSSLRNSVRNKNSVTLSVK